MHRNLHKYTKVARTQNRVEVKSMIDLVLVKKYMLCCYVLDVSQITMLYCVNSGWLVEVWIRKRWVVFWG